MRYYIDFDFDCEGEPPRTIICQDPGYQVVHVFESPTLKPVLKSSQVIAIGRDCGPRTQTIGNRGRWQGKS